MPVKPQGKEMLAQALPATGGHVLALREMHTQTGHYAWLKANLPELVRTHALGTYGSEHYGFMMLFEWAYEDGRLGTPEQAKTMLRNAYCAYARVTDTEIAAATAEANFAIAAHKAGVRVVHFDARKDFLDEFAEWDGWLEKFRKDYPNGIAFERLQTHPQRYAWLLTQAEKLYKAHPEYRARIKAIDSMINTMRDQHIPNDEISACIANALAASDRNMVTVSGALHLGGQLDASRAVNGLFDEGLANRRTVTDAWIGTAQELAEATRKAEKSTAEQGNCGNADQPDYLYLCDKDVLVTRGRGAAAAAPYGVRYDAFACPDGARVETMYTPSQLHPERVPELQEAIHQLQAAMAAPAAKQPAATPKPAQGMRR